MEPIDLAKQLAHQAGEIMLRNFTQNMTKEWKSDHTPVTETDLAINSLVITEVNRHFPGHSVKGEEEQSLTDSEYLWVCDPVDGTIPFSHGLPISTFSLALVRDGVSILGVVYDPFMNRLFWAQLGQGAYLNDQKIQVNASNELAHQAMTMEMWPQAKYRIWNLYQELENQNVKVMRPCSFCIGGALVASGDLIGSVFPGRTNHDIAALKVIVEEAGGKVTDLFGNEQRYDREINGALVSNGLVHDQLLAIIAEELNQEPRPNSSLNL